jgi:hypothetical protein
MNEYEQRASVGEPAQEPRHAWDVVVQGSAVGLEGMCESALQELQKSKQGAHSV